MECKNNDKNGVFHSLIGTPTPAKASGLTYSLAAILSVVVAFLFLIGIAVLGLAKEGYENSDWYLYCSYLLTPLTFLWIAYFVLRWSRQSFRLEIRAQACPIKYFAIAILLQCGLFCLSMLNTEFLEWLEKFGYEDTPIQLPSMDGFGLIGVLFTIAVMPAIFEELIFRGLLLKGMISFGTVGAVFLNGALFALYHQNPAQTLYQFCCGCAFALVAIRAGSILPTVVSHFINNALIVILTKFGIVDIGGVVVLIISILCLIASLVWLLFFDKGKNETCNKINKTEIKSFFLYASVGIAMYALTWISVLLTGL
jgi:membrane protease YdiL (CAAX protease family)